MAGFKSNPFETSFENLTTKAAGAAKKAVRAAGDAAASVAADVKQQISGDYGQSLIEQAGLKQTTPAQQQQIVRDQGQALSQARQRLEEINAEIKKARELRQKREEDRKKVEQREKQQKQAEEKKKEEDPIWKRMLRGKMGSREMSKNVAG